MICVQRMAAQGDVLFRRVENIPADALLRPRDGAIVVAHSETGHHHVIESPDVQLYTAPNPFVCYLRIDGPYADVIHQREFHTHETLRLLASDPGPSYFEVRDNAKTACCLGTPRRTEH